MWTELRHGAAEPGRGASRTAPGKEMGRHGRFARRPDPRSVRRPGRTGAWWATAVVVSAVVAILLLGPPRRLRINLTATTESPRASLRPEERLRPAKLLLVSSTRASVDQPAFRAYVERVQPGLHGLGPEVVTAAVTHDVTRNPGSVFQDRRDTVVPIVLAGNVGDATRRIFGCAPSGVGRERSRLHRPRRRPARRCPGRAAVPGSGDDRTSGAPRLVPAPSVRASAPRGRRERRSGDLDTGPVGTFTLGRRHRPTLMVAAGAATELEG